MKTLFFNLLKKEIVEYLTKKFTPENVQDLLNRVLALAKEQAAKTQTDFDDSLIKAVEYLIVDTHAAEKLVNLALMLLDAHICADAQAAQTEVFPIGNELAVAMREWAEKQW